MAEEQVKEAKEVKAAKETAAETKKWSSDIKKLGDKIVSLTLMQAKELGDYLKDEHGIEPAAGGAVMVAGPASGGEAEHSPRGLAMVGPHPISIRVDAVGPRWRRGR